MKAGGKLAFAGKEENFGFICYQPELLKYVLENMSFTPAEQKLLATYVERLCKPSEIENLEVFLKYGQKYIALLKDDCFDVQMAKRREYFSDVELKPLVDLLNQYNLLH